MYVCTFAYHGATIHSVAVKCFLLGELWVTFFNVLLFLIQVVWWWWWLRWRIRLGNLKLLVLHRGTQNLRCGRGIRLLLLLLLLLLLFLLQLNLRGDTYVCTYIYTAESKIALNGHEIVKCI